SFIDIEHQNIHSFFLNSLTPFSHNPNPNPIQQEPSVLPWFLHNPAAAAPRLHRSSTALVGPLWPLLQPPVLRCSAAQCSSDECSCARALLSISNLDMGENKIRRNSTLICVPIMDDSVDKMLVQARKAKDKGADLVEIRLDFLKNFNPNFDLEALIKSSCLPTLVTFRPTWEGGQYDGDESKRRSALCKAMELGANYIDVELKVADEFFESISGKKSTKTAIIVSSHNYQCTPSVEEIGNLVSRIQATGADIVKIATTATDITDCARILQVLTHPQVPIIGLVMGEKGLISRVLCAKFGGYLTFGTLEEGAVSAPGQPTITTLLDLYNFRHIGLDTKIFGIIGNPVGHSKSPLMFNAAFKSDGFDGIYVPLLVENVPNFLLTYSSPDFIGYSVTIPHKMAGLECCEEVDPIAKAIGAINCLVRRPSDGKLAGYNFDYMGAIEAIEEGLQDGGSIAPISPLAGKLCVVIGAGGAGKALAYGGKAKGARVVVANRTLESAADLANKVGGKAISLDELDDFAPEEGMVLVNTTSVGMKPKTNETPISKKALKHYALVFDAVYTPKLTRLLRESQESGAIIVYGTEMLLNQAFKQYEQFTGLPAPKELMREVLSKST
ncbi:Bifunctional 3-dehydroquinate dehydratase/shikimate dehydrogenase chloroplastic, partial [Bienertia sinuspersici]